MKQKSDHEKISPIFSLLDPFEYKSERLFEFIDLGSAALGVRHIIVFVKNVASSILCFDTDSISVNKYISLHNINGNDGSLFGILIVIKNGVFYTMTKQTLFIGEKHVTDGEFTVFPYKSEKSPVFIFKRHDDVLINIGSTNNEFVVQDM